MQLPLLWQPLVRGIQLLYGNASLNSKVRLMQAFTVTVIGCREAPLADQATGCRRSPYQTNCCCMLALQKCSGCPPPCVLCLVPLQPALGAHGQKAHQHLGNHFPQPQVPASTAALHLRSRVAALVSPMLLRPAQNLKVNVFSKHWMIHPWSSASGACQSKLYLCTCTI